MNSKSNHIIDKIDFSFGEYRIIVIHNGQREYLGNLFNTKDEAVKFWKEEIEGWGKLIYDDMYIIKESFEISLK